MAERSPRKLAVILHADVVDSTALVRSNETLAHERMQDTFQRFTKTINSYGGITHELRGDALVAEFDRASDAIAAALVFQIENHKHNASLEDEVQPHLRIGIAMGEVVIADNTVTGDGVVLAQRLEQLAESGGVCIQDAAYQTVPKRLPFEYKYLGEQALKGFEDPGRVFAVTLNPGASAPLPEQRRDTKETKPIWRTVAVAVVVVVIVIGGGIAFWQQRLPKEDPANVSRMAYPLPNKPSIAVLPFNNLSGDAEQEYFVDGMTEDMITDLSKLSGLFVIARNSTFTYKGKAVKIRQISEELGVRYVLEGSVRRAGDKIRINVQLIDAISGGHLWADRYDGSLEDVFGLQDSVTQKVVAALSVQLTPVEQAKSSQSETDSAEAYDAFLRGWSHYRRNTPDDYAKAIPYFEKAINLDPNYSRAYAALAAVYWSVVDRDRSTGATTWSRALGMNTDESRRLEQLALEQAMASPIPLAYQVASGRLSRQGQHKAAIAKAKQAIALDANDPVAYQAMATALIYAGRPTEAVGQIKQAMRLDPRFPHEYLYWLGLAQFGMGRFEDAAQTLTRATQSNPDDERNLIVLASTYGHLGKVQEAKSAVEKADTLRNERQQRFLTDSNLEVGVDVLLAGPYTLKDVDLWQFKEGADRERLHEGLRLAGVPEAGKGKNVSPTKVIGATTIDAAEAKRLHNRGVTFVDVRGKDSYNDGHIPGAAHLYLKEGFDEAALTAVATKGQEVVIYCQGPRCLLSSKACAKAIAWGFTKLYYFREGFPSWKAAGYLVDVPSG